MPENADQTNHPLDRYRSYLLLLARMQLDSPLRHKVEPSDVVQQTMLEAYGKQEQYQGNESGFVVWLRSALANNIRDALRRLRRQKRDFTRDRSLEQSLAQSSERLANCLAADDSSPSQKAIRQEDLLRLADALLQLPDAQREAVVLHHLQGCTLSEVASQLDRTDAAVAGLLHRGLRKLRELIYETR